MNALMFLAGLAALILGAELLVRGASRLALSLGLSPLVVGLTVVALGTSAPEMSVAVGAALKGSSDLVLGNVVGSNIANVLLILGVSALIVPLTVDRQLIRLDAPMMLGVSVLVLVMALDGRIGMVDAVVLTAALVAYLTFTVRQARSPGPATDSPVSDDAVGSPLPPSPTPDSRPLDSTADSAQPRHERAWQAMQGHWAGQVALVLVGLALLVLGSQWMVDAAVAFARAFGLSEAVIGLTIVAIGTSMPELAASVTAALRGQRDMAVGNVVGSNLFNLMGCLGLSGLVAGMAGADGLAVAPAIQSFDLWVMVATALVCLPVFITGREIARWEGALLLAYMVAYLLYLVLAQQAHDALPMLSSTMLMFVIPLTALVLTVSLVRSRLHQRRQRRLRPVTSGLSAARTAGKPR